MQHNNTLVWVGAGKAETHDIEQYENVLLLEARKDAVDELKDRFQDAGSVKVQRAVVAERNDEQVFYHRNIVALSGLCEQIEKNSMFPGLANTAKELCSTVTLQEALTTLSLTKEQTNTLYIDIPDMCFSLVNGLSNDVLSHFSQLIVSIPEERLFKDALTVEGLQNYLEPIGFERPFSIGGDGLLEQYLFTRSQWFDKAQDLETDLKRQSDSSQASVKQLEEQVDKLKEQLLSIEKEKEALAKVGADREAKFSKLEKQLIVLKDEKQALCDAAEVNKNQLKELQNKLNQAATEVQQLEEVEKKLKQALQQRLQELNKSREENQKLLDENAVYLKKQVAIEQEMAKAHSQIELLKELILEEKEGEK